MTRAPYQDPHMLFVDILIILLRNNVQSDLRAIITIIYEGLMNSYVNHYEI